MGMGAVEHSSVKLARKIHIRAELCGPGDLGHTALADLCMADDSLAAIGVLSIDDQAVPTAAFLHHRVLLSFSAVEDSSSRCCRYRFSSSPKFLMWMNM